MMLVMGVLQSLEREDVTEREREQKQRKTKALGRLENPSGRFERLKSDRSVALRPGQLSTI